MKIDDKDELCAGRGLIREGEMELRIRKEDRKMETMRKMSKFQEPRARRQFTSPLWLHGVKKAAVLFGECSHSNII